MKYNFAKWIFIFSLITYINSVIGQSLDSTKVRSLLFRVPYTNQMDSILYNDSVTIFMPNSWVKVNKRFISENGFTCQRIGFLGQRLDDYYISSVKAKRNHKYFKIARVVGVIETLVLFPLFLKMEIDYTNEFNAKYSAPYPDIKQPSYLHYSMLCLISGTITYHFAAKHFFKKSIREYKKSSAAMK